MKDIFREYAAYNLWANTQILGTTLGLSNDQQHRTIESSCSSIYKTVLHMWQAESLWLQRLKGGAVVKPEDNFNGSMEALGDALLKNGALWDAFIDSMSDEDLSRIVSYTNIKGVFYQVMMRRLLLHVFNHNTHHRGQWITMLRQAGATQIPITDFSHYASQMA